MKPILYDSDTLDFGTNNGIGILSDTSSCKITEEKNGEYELEMQYPTSGLHYAEIKLSRILYVRSRPSGGLQAFRIYRITKPLNNVVSVYAHHISYDLSGVVVSPFSANTIATVMQKIKSNSANSNPFTFSADFAASGAYQLSAPASLRSLLGGANNSILAVFGGEYEFDNLNVILHASRGADRGVTLRYGKNLTALTQETNNEDTVTGIYPYYFSDTAYVALPEKVIYITESPAREIVVPVDLTRNFESVPSVSQLRAAAQQYVAANSFGTGAMSIDVSFAQLEGEYIELCDVVSVEYPNMGISVKAQCVKTVYNPLTDRYTSIEIGDIQASIASTIAAASQTASGVQKSIMYSETDGTGTRATSVSAGVIRLDSVAEGTQYGTQIWRSSIVWYENGAEVGRVDASADGIKIGGAAVGISTPPVVTGGANTRLKFYAQGNLAGCYAVSSITSAQEDIANITAISESAAQNIVANLRPVTFESAEDTDASAVYGFVAEEVESIAPLLCDYIEENGTQRVRNVQYDRLTAIIIKELQRINARLSAL